MFESLFSSYIENIYAEYINIIYVCAVLSGLLKLSIIFIDLHNYIFNAFLRKNAGFILFPKDWTLHAILWLKRESAVEWALEMLK